MAKDRDTLFIMSSRYFFSAPVNASFCVFIIVTSSAPGAELRLIRHHRGAHRRKDVLCAKRLRQPCFCQKIA